MFPGDDETEQSVNPLSIADSVASVPVVRRKLSADVEELLTETAPEGRVFRPWIP